MMSRKVEEEIKAMPHHLYLYQASKLVLSTIETASKSKYPDRNDGRAVVVRKQTEGV